MGQGPGCTATSKVLPSLFGGAAADSPAVLTLLPRSMRRGNSFSFAIGPHSKALPSCGCLTLQLGDNLCRFQWPWGQAHHAGANAHASDGATAVAAAVAAAATRGPATAHATAAGDASALLQLPHAQVLGWGRGVSICAADFPILCMTPLNITPCGSCRRCCKCLLTMLMCCPSTGRWRSARRPDALHGGHGLGVAGARRACGRVRHASWRCRRRVWRRLWRIWHGRPRCCRWQRPRQASFLLVSPGMLFMHCCGGRKGHRRLWPGASCEVCLKARGILQARSRCAMRR